MTKKMEHNIPEANKLARSIRNGSTVNDLAVYYGLSGVFIANRLVNAGWDPDTGERCASIRTRTPLTELGQGPGEACHHVGGGDNPDVVPTQSRPYARRVRRPGIVWPERPPIDTKAVVKRLRETDPETSQREKLDVRSIAHRLTAAERDELIRRYKDGEASTKLAAAYGLTSRSVRKFLRRNGVELRSRADANRLRFTEMFPGDPGRGPEAA